MLGMRLSPSARELLRRSARPLRIVVAIALVAWLWTRADVDSLSTALRAADPWLLLLALALVPVSIGIRAYNLALLANRDRKVLSARESYSFTLIGAGVALLLPSGPADLVKANIGHRIHGNAESIVPSTLLDKLTSVIAVAAMGTVGAAVVHDWLLAGIALALTVVTALPLAFPRIVPWHLAMRFLARDAEVDPEQLSAAIRPPLPLLSKVMGVSVMGWLCTYLIVWVVCRALHADVSLAYLLALAPFTSLAKLVPISAAGIGLGELTLAALLVRVGVADATAVRVALVSMVLLVLMPGAAGGFLLLRGRGKRSAGASAV
jgi:uncharacterized membrane protein YbhN (UPF0104 family)